ncbi:MAG: phosphosulfolactate synthase [Candidatus Latescibacteria bacterium]|nr:phosphosulfolactate synthase [Candidatus Latescibacterota bacterium]
MYNEHIFGGLDGRQRSRKPRDLGLTMVVDWGFGSGAQSDLIETAAPFFDFAKVAVGISRLLSDDVLNAKIKNYLDHNIEPFPGGQYLEYAQVQGAAHLYFPAVAEAGYRWVEVSDNLAAVTHEWKLKMIRQAVELHGLTVLGEVGQKEGLDAGIPMADDVKACLDAGSRIVLLEAAELVHEDAGTARQVEQAVEAAGPARVMFELPGPWIAGVHPHDVHRMRRTLVDRYGPEVNLGNVLPDDLMTLEAYRRGLGVNAGSPSEEG